MELTERTQRVLRFVKAHTESNVPWSTTTLLLGLARESSGLAGTALQEQGLSYIAMCKALDGWQHFGPDTVLDNILVDAQNIAQRLDHISIGTEHLLLSLVEGLSCHATVFLQQQSVELADVHLRLMTMLGFEPEIKPDDPDADLRILNRSQLLSELIRLRTAVRRHRDEKGNDRCWLDDAVLYAHLPDTTVENLPKPLPPLCEFIPNCYGYHHRRNPPGMAQNSCPGASGDC